MQIYRKLSSSFGISIEGDGLILLSSLYIKEGVGSRSIYAMEINDTVNIIYS